MKETIKNFFKNRTMSIDEMIEHLADKHGFYITIKPLRYGSWVAEVYDLLHDTMEIYSVVSEDRTQAKEYAIEYVCKKLEESHERHYNKTV